MRDSGSDYRFKAAVYVGLKLSSDDAELLRSMVELDLQSENRAVHDMAVRLDVMARRALSKLGGEEEGVE